MQQRVTALKTDRNMWTPEALLEAWHRSLQEKDRKAGTVDVGDPHPDCLLAGKRSQGWHR